MSDFERPSLTVGFTTPFAEPTDQDAARLLVIGGPLRGASFELSGESIDIGRRDECVITLPSSSVSKVHAVLHRDAEGRYAIEDRGSTNGTEVNGRRLEPNRRLMLSIGDSILVAPFTLLYLGCKALSAGAPAPVAIDTAAAADEAGALVAVCEDMVSFARNRRSARARED